jgi:hypothetical protein
VSINPPRDLSLINVQRAFEDVTREIRRLERKLDEARGAGGAAAEIGELRGQIQALWRYHRALNPNDVFRASGAAHALGLVPDPGAAAATARFLREDATWVAAVPSAGGAMSGTLDLSASTIPTITFDSGDYVYYDKTYNALVFVGGGVIRFTLDTAGNVSAVGTIRSSVPITAAFWSTAFYTGAGYLQPQWTNSISNSGSVISLQNSGYEVKVSEAGSYQISTSARLTLTTTTIVDLTIARFSSGGVAQKYHSVRVENNSTTAALTLSPNHSVTTPAAANDYFVVFYTIIAGAINAVECTNNFNHFDITKVN